MFGKCAISSILAAIVTVAPALAQDVELAMKKKIIVADGPYEIKDEGGVIGFVVADAGKTVTFKPCVGDSFSLDRNKLVKTKNKCKDSPPTEENPLIASCSDANDWSSQIKLAMSADKPVGTTYFSNDGSNTMASVTTDPKEMAKTVDNAYGLKDCGGFTIGFDSKGKIDFSIVPSMQAIKIDGMQ